MNLPARLSFMVIASLISLLISHCTTVSVPENTVTNPQQPTNTVVLTFDETAIPDHCQVFSHLMFTVPPDFSKDKLRQAVETFAQTHGSDYLLIGLARESSQSSTSVTFQEYGPTQPYLFSQQWTGWRFGFGDWTGGGPLVDYGSNHLRGSEVTFDRQVDIQAILLSCQIGPAQP